MSDDKTAETLELPSFQQQVLRRLDEIGARLSQLERNEAERAYDTTPMWDKLVKSFSDMSDDVNQHFDKFSNKLDAINKDLLQVKGEGIGIERRLSKLELEAHPQIVLQDQEF